MNAKSKEQVSITWYNLVSLNLQGYYLISHNITMVLLSIT